MVDFLLQTQDLNQDGLLAPSELLSPSLTHTQVQQTRDRCILALLLWFTKLYLVLFTPSLFLTGITIHHHNSLP